MWTVMQHLNCSGTYSTIATKKENRSWVRKCGKLGNYLPSKIFKVGSTVLKQNGAVGICGDYKVTVNQACLTDSYPLSRVEELLASLSGINPFSKLDMSQAYLQPLGWKNPKRMLGYADITCYPLEFHPLPPSFREWWKPCCKGSTEYWSTLRIFS